VGVGTEHNKVHTKMTKGQYCPVQHEQARLVSSLLYGILLKYMGYDHFHGNGSVWQNPDQEGSNQNGLGLPRNYHAM